MDIREEESDYMGAPPLRETYAFRIPGHTTGGAGLGLGLAGLLGVTGINGQRLTAV